MHTVLDDVAFSYRLFESKGDDLGFSVMYDTQEKIDQNYLLKLQTTQTLKFERSTPNDFFNS
jgi:hypothetical protein